MRYRNLTLGVIMLFTYFVTTTGYLNGVLAGNGDNNNVVSGNVTNSKYLAITFHKYVNQKDTDAITGTIVNNSTKDISSVRVYAALYDDNNMLITTEAGVVNVPSLTPTLTSPFTISLVHIQKPDHYTLFPGGNPS
jgi:hypothetical protein